MHLNKFHASNRAQRRAIQRQIEKRWKYRKIIKANEAFNRIKPILLDFGWTYEDDRGNVVEKNGKWDITESPVLKLFNEIFNITLISHKDGIQISRLEVMEMYQGNGYAGDFLRSLLYFLTRLGIDNIYLIPMPAGMPYNRSFFALNTEQLESFYYKRGFRKLPNDDYWKLDTGLFKNYLADNLPDSDLLKKGYTSDATKNISNHEIKSFIWQILSSGNNSNRRA